MKKLSIFLLFICLVLIPTFAQAQIADLVKETVLKNMQETEAENTELMMNTIHTQSPYYLMTKQQMQPLFENYDLKYELISYEFIGESGEYAVARVVFKTTKLAGPAFKDNQLDVIQIYKQENNMWKLWSQASLSVDFLN